MLMSLVFIQRNELPCKAGTFSSETMKYNSILRLAIHENTWFASEYGKICLERKYETALVAFTPPEALVVLFI